MRLPSLNLRMALIPLVLCLIPIIGSQTLAAVPIVAEEAQSASLRRIINARVAEGFSGSVLIARADRILLHDGFGSLAGRQVGRDDRFWIASTGKQFVSAAILRLADRGLVTLDDRLDAFFPDTPDDKTSITLRQLLTHSSGIGQSYVSEEQVDRNVAVRAMLNEALAAQPGQEFLYSNSNFQLAAAVIEIVSGMEYRDFFEREFVEPLGLCGTGLADADSWALVNPAILPTPDRLQRAYWGEQGAYSTTGDLYRWTEALLNRDVLSASSTDALFAPTFELSTLWSALGWYLGEGDAGGAFIFTRGNEDFGANSLIYHYPGDDTIIVILTHAGSPGEDLSWSRIVLADIEQQLGL